MARKVKLGRMVQRVKWVQQVFQGAMGQLVLRAKLVPKV
jgi:hypothetical protein